MKLKLRLPDIKSLRIYGADFRKAHSTISLGNPMPILARRSLAP